MYALPSHASGPRPLPLGMLGLPGVTFAASFLLASPRTSSPRASPSACAVSGCLRGLGGCSAKLMCLGWCLAGEGEPGAEQWLCSLIAAAGRGEHGRSWLICSNTLILQLLSFSLPSLFPDTCMARGELKHGNDLAERQKQMLWTLSRCCSNCAWTPSPAGRPALGTRAVSVGGTLRPSGVDFPPERANVPLLHQVSTDRAGGVFKSWGQTLCFLES